MHCWAGGPAAFTHDGFSGDLGTDSVAHPAGSATVWANACRNGGAMGQDQSEHCLQPRREHPSPVRGCAEHREEGDVVVGRLVLSGVDVE